MVNALGCSLGLNTSRFERILALFPFTLPGALHQKIRLLGGAASNVATTISGMIAKRIAVLG